MSERLESTVDLTIDALGCRDTPEVRASVRAVWQGAVRELLKDISWDDVIEQEAQRLFKANERERGGVRPQVITPEDSMDYWTMVATIAEIRRRAGIGEEGQ